MQFDRFINLIGEENFKKIENLNILVIGIGGVGSFTIESLARSGIKHLTIVDFDKVDITNINRQLVADLSTIGKSKTTVMRDRIALINKDAKVKVIDKFINENNIDELFKENYDYIIDCCDTVETKKLIIKTCLNKNIKFITCMGTGNKLDPTKLKIIDIRKTSYDPLAKKLRKWVTDQRLKGKILCVSSDEIVKKKGTTISSCSFVPSTAGLVITSYIINDVISVK